MVTKASEAFKHSGHSGSGVGGLLVESAAMNARQSQFGFFSGSPIYRAQVPLDVVVWYARNSSHLIPD